MYSKQIEIIRIIARFFTITPPCKKRDYLDVRYTRSIEMNFHFRHVDCASLPKIILKYEKNTITSFSFPM